MRKVRFTAIYDQPLAVGGTCPVKIDGSGLFHAWGLEYKEFESGPIHRTVGLVECTGLPFVDAGKLTIGKIYKVEPTDIIFLEPFKA